MARGLKFPLWVVEGLYYPYSENKGADQLRGYREADLRLCFRICKNPVFSRRGSIITRKIFDSPQPDVNIRDILDGIDSNLVNVFSDGISLCNLGRDHFKVKNMQGPGTEAIITQIQPLNQNVKIQEDMANRVRSSFPKDGHPAIQTELKLI